MLVGIALPEPRPGRRALRDFRVGLTTGLVYFAGTLYWVVEVMQAFGGLSVWIAAPVGALLAAYLALYPAFFALVLGGTLRRFGFAAIWCAPFFWVAAEWLRSWIGGGFPWVLLGASQANVLPIVQAASVVGVFGLSWLVALVNTAAAVLALTRRPGHRWAAAGVAIALVVIALAGVRRVVNASLTQTGDAIRVGLVQGSVDQVHKYDPRFRDEILSRYLNLSREVIGAGAGLVIWPEASTPFYFDLNAALAEPVRRLASETGTPFLIGTDEFSVAHDGAPDRFFNSAVLVDRDGRSQGAYRKMHLVPFGEYVPLKRLLFFVGPLIEAVSDFSPGTEASVFDVDGKRVSVAICYESVYPSVARAFVAGGSQLLVTITNDAWFGRSSAAYQHFAQGALRAVEQGRYLVRAANTGISGAVDPYGRVLAATGLFVPAAITVDVRLRDARTFYSRVGDLTVWISLLVMAGGVAGLLPIRRVTGA